MTFNFQEKYLNYCDSHFWCLLHVNKVEIQVFTPHNTEMDFKIKCFVTKFTNRWQEFKEYISSVKGFSISGIKNLWISGYTRYRLYQLVLIFSWILTEHKVSTFNRFTYFIWNYKFFSWTDVSGYWYFHSLVLFKL